MCSQREKLGKEKVQSWSKMKKLLKSKVMPPYYLQESFSKLHFIKQGTRTIEEFTQEFEHLLMKCGLNPDDPQTLVRYLGGLEPRIANVVELHPYSTLAELTLMSHKVEAQQRTHGKLEVSKPVIKTIAPAPTPSSLTPTVPPPSKTIDLKESSTITSKHSRRCFRCQGLAILHLNAPINKSSVWQNLRP
ncbi:putative retrotransposon gag domain-containing protein [Helianthus anomalus]